MNTVTLFSEMVLASADRNFLALLVNMLVFGSIPIIILLIVTHVKKKNRIALFNSQKEQMPIKQSEALLKFKQLLDSGAITQDEYDRIKTKLIQPTE